MTIREHLHNMLPLLTNPLSLIELARSGCLPPALSVSDIALLWSDGGKHPREAIEIIIRRAISLGELAPLTVQEWSRIIIEFERSRDCRRYIEQKPNQMPPMEVCGTGYTESDLIVESPKTIDGGEEDQSLSTETERRLWVVHRDALERWLKKENEWPLSQGCLLIRWWDKEASGKLVADQHIEGEAIENTFRLEKEHWRVRFRGRVYTIRQSIGMQYITHLIQRAYHDQREMHASDLYYLIHKRPAVQDKVLSRMTREQLSELGLDVSDLGEGLDLMTPEGKQWAGRQVKELRRLIEEAEEEGNSCEAFQLRETKEALDEYLQKAFGLSGRVRKGSDPNERMRKTVSKAIANTLDKLGRKDGDQFAIYLDDHLDRGLFCSFRKDPNISWRIMEK